MAKRGRPPKTENTLKNQQVATDTIKKILPAGRPGVANPIDIHVGARLRLRRSILGMSQEQLGNELGLTFQQIQKYERGTNRLGASRLWDVSRVLDVPIQFFFDDMAQATYAQAPRLRAGLSDVPQAHYDAGDDPMVKRETLDLVRAYYRIANPDVRRSILELCKSMVNMRGYEQETTDDEKEDKNSKN